MPTVNEQRSLAARVAGCADLQDVRLFAVVANLGTAAFEDSLSYSLSSDITYQTLGEPVGTVIVGGDYVVKVFDPSKESDASDDDSDASVAEISFTLAALFTVPEPDDEHPAFEDGEFEAFAATTGQFALYPYAREFVSDITSRMGLPSLHVRTLRIELDSRTGD